MANRRRLRVAMVAPPWFPVPPLGYGGIEVVVHLLAAGLRARGHQVTLFAAAGSDQAHRAVTLAGEDWGAQLGTPNQRIREATFQLRVFRELARRSSEFDIVHLHNEYAGMVGAHFASGPAPFLATVHGGINQPVLTFLREVDREVELVAISQAQRDQAPAVRWNSVVHNAVSREGLTFRATKEEYLLQLARITPEKGQHWAIEVAERAGLPLVLAGKVDQDGASQKYFAEQIEPRLGSRVRWIEDARGTDKADLIAGAAAMLFPIEWDEPFGLAMVEAMISGTPVLAFPRGAATELVEDGLTGYLAADVDDMVRLLPDARRIDAAACARRAEERFSVERMTEGYERAYESALQPKLSQRPARLA
ncbi:MAG: glycosyltransferase family 4 protein [Candidatus Dormibacteraeota bacterium]|nr:glycosyltransferase family 4 protein [Candidatus Dormibacteraeota bacterium]